MLLGTGACGGSDKLSKPEYIAEGDALCQRFVDQSEAAMEGVETTEQLSQAFGKLIADAKQVDTDLEALSPPDDATEVDAKLLDSLRKTTTAMGQVVDALERNDDSWQQLLEEADRVGSASDAAAKAYGFEVCGSEGELPET